MGGGGSYYDRDVTRSSNAGSQGYSQDAQEALSNNNLDQRLLPRLRVIATESKNPVVLILDVTGSMGRLPKTFWDKAPMVAGQIVENGYLRDPEVSLAFVGDTQSDLAPLQICDFSKVKDLDSWLTRGWLEGNGGGQSVESYEIMAYYYAYIAEIPKDSNPILIITGDEGFRDKLSGSELGKHLGGRHKNIDASEVFADLKKKFKNNVFLIHRTYTGGDDARIVGEWEEVLGEENVIRLPEDLAVADVMLGIFALATDTRTLDEYAGDMESRGQTKDRVTRVRKALEKFAAMRGKNVKVKKGAPPPIVLPDKD